MFCPKCQAEYQDGYTVCSDCRVELVPELPKHGEKQGFVAYEIIMPILDMGTMALIKSVFDAEGLTYFIQGENMAYRSIPASLMVKKDQVERAKEILEELL